MNPIAQAVKAQYGRFIQRLSHYDLLAYDLAGGPSRHIRLAIVGAWAKASGR